MSKSPLITAVAQPLPCMQLRRHLRAAPHLLHRTLSFAHLLCFARPARAILCLEITEVPDVSTDQSLCRKHLRFVHFSFKSCQHLQCVSATANIQSVVIQSTIRGRPCACLRLQLVSYTYWRCSLRVALGKDAHVVRTKDSMRCQGPGINTQPLALDVSLLAGMSLGGKCGHLHTHRH